jgi:uncharacterized membrane protein
MINAMKVALIAALPISELRGAIPLALTVYKMPIIQAYFCAVLGNILPVVFLLLYLRPFFIFLRRWHYFELFFSWLFKRTRRHEEQYEKFGALFLLFFVAVPLPVTGAWTGSVAAFVFGIRFKYAFPSILGGIIIAGLIVSLTSLGIISIF